jgi:ribonuclease G
LEKELIINKDKSELSIALLENKKLIELHKAKHNRQFNVGDIYLARAKKIMNGLNAAFVDVGYKRDAFLHYFDLGPQFNSQQKFIRLAMNKNSPTIKLPDFIPEKDLDKKGKISDVLQANYLVMVQIAKEPISTKGPRLTSEISIAGRNLVLIPFSNKVSVSQKIVNKEERNRLIKLIKSIKPKNFGVIIRTVAKNRRVAVLDEELRALIAKWETITDKVKTAEVPEMLVGELDRPAALMRDILNDSFSSIHVNDSKIFSQVKDYVTSISPEQAKIVKLYSGGKNIFEQFGVYKQIKASFGKTINIQSGAYLIIEHTEALHVIDVNSGNRSKKANDQESNALEVNMLAAEEVARQLRLRDMGGIVVVDFIDMYSRENRRKIYDKMKSEMAKDKTKHAILPLSKFGLMQITRQRVRPATNIETKETCPTCDGTGEVTPSILFIDEIESHLRYIAEKHKGTIHIRTHPYIEGFLNRGLLSPRIKWMLKYKRRIMVHPVITYSFLEYNFYDSNMELIKVN